MNKHTPGPWIAGNGKKGTPAETSVYAEIKDIQVKIAWCDATLGYPHCVANARLIAAAPDLLRALQEIRARLTEHPAYADLTETEEDDIGGDTAELSYLARVARAAIAKAEGSA